MKPYHILSFGAGQPALDSALNALPIDEYEVTCIEERNDYFDTATSKDTDLALLNFITAKDPATEICQKLKKNKKTKRMPIIISLETDNLEEIIDCYDAGAFDVISKKNSSDEIQKRIQIAIESYHHAIKLEEKAKKAKQAAFDAMEDSNKLGTVIEFMARSVNCDSFESLATLTFEVFGKLHVHGSIILHTRKGDFFFADDGQEKPLEEQLITKYKEHVDSGENTDGRFKTFSNRVLVASHGASILIRDVPDDETEAGRLRDLLGALINVLDARSLTICHLLSQEQKIALTKDLISSTKAAMDELEKMFKYNESETTAVMDTLMEDTHNGLMTLCLTDEQENYFLQLLDQSMGRLTNLYTQNIMIDRHFEKIIASLTKLTNEI